MPSPTTSAQLASTLDSGPYRRWAAAHPPRLLASLAGVLICALAAALTAAPAQALVSHRYEASIAEVPSSCPGAQLPPPWGELNAMTVDSGHLWVADRTGGTSRTDQFGAQPPFACERELSSHRFELPNGVAVGHPAAGTRVFTGYRSGEVDVSDAETGALLETWSGFGGGVSAVAVDNSSAPGDWAAGDVLVGTFNPSAIDVLEPQAGGGEKQVAQLTGAGPAEPFTDIQSLVVDPVNGDLLVQNSTEPSHNVFHPFIDVLEPAAPGEYKFARRITGTPSGPFDEGGLSLAVDASAVLNGQQGQIYASTGDGVIDEFSMDGEFLGRVTSAALPEGGLSGGPIAVDPLTHRLFATIDIGNPDRGGTRVIDVLGPNVVTPDPATEAPSNLKLEAESHLWSLRLRGTVDPDNAGPATCQFLWGTTKAFGNVAPCTAAVPNGSSPAPVHATLNGLQPDQTYYYRLQAENANGLNPGEEAQDEVLTTPGPGLHGESVSDVSDSAATLEATIAPHDAPTEAHDLQPTTASPTTYYFQYSTEPTAGCPASPSSCAQLPLTPQSTGATSGEVELSQPLTGLAPATTYHYRLIASSEAQPGLLEEFPGPDRTFTTQGPAAPLTLPDHRAWELVSPPDKRGAVLAPVNEGGAIQAAAGGGAVTYLATNPTEAQPQGYANEAQVLSARGPGGWQSRDISIDYAESPGPSVGAGQEYRLFSADLSLGLLQPFQGFKPLLSPPPSEPTDYLRTDFPPGDPSAFCAESCYRPLGPGGGFLAATPDFGHVVLASGVALTAGGSPGDYEWDRASGHLTYLGPGEVPPTHNGISADGSRVIVGDLSLDTATGQSLRFDAAEPGCGSCVSGGGAFQLASADGSRIFFTDSNKLTEASSAQAGPDLYECQILEATGEEPHCRLTDLTPEASGEHAAVQNVPGASEDGSYVYFLASGALTGEQQSSQGQSAVPGQPNLYLSHAGATTFIATLSAVDGNGGSGVAARLEGLAARVSPDGRWLAFMSQRPLTGYDNRDAVSAKPDEEVFLYHAPTADGQAGSLVCASCNPTGARPHGLEYGTGSQPGEKLNGGFADGNRLWGSNTWIAANVPPWRPYGNAATFYQPRYISNGGRLLFDSSDALVPQDTNGAEDVYQYEPPGGEAESPPGDTCATSSPTYSPRSEGCVDLISSGASPEESALLDASESGQDVFFVTNARLSPRDTDTALDVYDARSGGGEAEPLKPVECSGDACQPPAEAPNDPTPGSLTFHGAGNVNEEPTKSPCPKGKVRKHGKCVAKHARKHHKRKTHREHKRAASHNRGGNK